MCWPNAALWSERKPSAPGSRIAGPLSSNGVQQRALPAAADAEPACVREEDQDMKSTTRDLRYLEAKDRFLEYAFLALGSHFPSKEAFLGYFESIQGDDNKSLFLRSASFYLFMVKCGDWIVEVPGSDAKVEYLTNTYKYIAIFSLIESLLAEDHIDFYQYLLRKKSKVKFPINDPDVLTELYRTYKAEFGAVGQCVSFFRSLSPERQKDLIRRLEVQGTQASLENLAKFMYELRSKFVHEGELVHHMSDGASVSFKGQKAIVCSLSIKDAQIFFEEGLLAHFKKGNT